MIKNCLGREGLQLIVTLTKQFHKLICCSNESVKEWMGRLRTAVVECKYKEGNRQLKEQFIHGLNDDEMLVEVIRKLTKCWEDVTIPVKLF